MNAQKYLLPMLFIAACNEPVVKTEPEPSILLQCEAFCEKVIDVCGYDPPGAEFGIDADECPTSCTERAQEKDCGAKKVALIECIAAQSCGDLRAEYAEGQLPPKEEDACRPQRDAFSVCDIVHHSPSGGS